mgnify:FL=1|tara:strand:+ start:1195 stop:1587 length:393 start_codon:yes stop_codon:yes gene_type:complete
MAYFAKINREHIVVAVHAVADAVAPTEAEGIKFLRDLHKEPDATWVQTFTDGTRKHYAGKGFTYNATEDAFLEPRPFPSWHLDKTTYTWKSPAGDVPETFDDGLVQKDGSTPLGDLYHWNELKKIWDKTV